MRPSRRIIHCVALVSLALSAAFGPPMDTGKTPKDWQVRMAQLGREVQRKKMDYNYHEDPPPGTVHAPFKDALLTRCSLRVFRSRALYTRYCPKASPTESARLSDMLRRIKENCDSVHSAEQIEYRLRVALAHPTLGGNASCIRDMMAHSDRIGRASVDSLAKLQALYSTSYPNQLGRNRSPHPTRSHFAP